MRYTLYASYAGGYNPGLAGVHHYVRGEHGTRLFKTWGQRCALPNPVWW